MTDPPYEHSQEHQIYEFNGLKKITSLNPDLHFPKLSIKLKNRLGRELPVFPLILCRNIWRWLFLSTYYPQSTVFFSLSMLILGQNLAFLVVTTIFEIPQPN